VFQVPQNPLLSVRRDPHIIRMNSSREIVVVDNIEVPTGPNARSGVEDPLFQSESFRTLAHTVETSNPSSIPLTVRDLYDNLGVSPDQPMASQMLEMFVTYTVPLDHFTGTTSSVTVFLDQLLVGSHLILPLRMAHSIMVPQATRVSNGNVVVTQAPIGTPLPPRPNPSLPPGYKALNTSIAIPTQVPSGGSRILFLLGTMLRLSSFPHLPRFSPEGLTFLLRLC
jgi:hypothetical protein